MDQYNPPAPGSIYNWTMVRVQDFLLEAFELLGPESLSLDVPAGTLTSQVFFLVSTNPIWRDRFNAYCWYHVLE
jgi:hypothetical protein